MNITFAHLTKRLVSEWHLLRVFYIINYLLLLLFSILIEIIFYFNFPSLLK